MSVINKDRCSHQWYIEVPGSPQHKTKKGIEQMV